jgi:polyisoprenoid-binding protein YceI
MKRPLLYRALILLILPFTTMTALAGWELDTEQSSLQFISVKNNSVAELHHFKMIHGTMSDNGDVQLEIPLASVETGIEIRNERLKSLLFDIASMPVAQINAKIDQGQVESLLTGQLITQSITFTLSLHGTSQDYEVAMNVVRLRNGDLMATTASPIFLNASDFDLVAGIEKLREIAGLTSIVTTVPVSATLILTPVDEK